MTKGSRTCPASTSSASRTAPGQGPAAPRPRPSAAAAPLPPEAVAFEQPSTVTPPAPAWQNNS
jgi:hypothetical protein